MKENYLFDMSFNNVLFQDRNKSYGAYLLRQNYNKHITFAAITGTILFASIVISPIVKDFIFPEKVVAANTGKDVLPDEGTVVDILPDLPKPKPKQAEPVPVQPKQEKVATQKFVTTKVVANTIDTPEEMPEQADLQNAVISTKTEEGIAPATPTVNVEPEAPAGLGTGSATTNEPYTIVENMPKFGNGEADLMQYLSKNIRYPARARNAGVEGLVIVNFVVTPSGDIEDINILKGLGYGTEEEAIRVINKMPKWIPGRQNGRAVPVRFTLPIRLQLQN